MKNQLITKTWAWLLSFGLLVSLVPTGSVQAQSTTTYKAELINVDVANKNLKPGQKTTLALQVKNTGTQSWSNIGDNIVKIGTVSPYDRLSRFYDASWLSSNRLTAVNEQVVNPGQVATFTATLMASGVAGKAVEEFGLVAEGKAWFDFKFSVAIDIAAANYDVQLISPSTFNLELKAGETHTIATKLKNIGDVDLLGVGANALKIGTSAPYDRKSKLQHSSWLSGNRVATLSGPLSLSNEGELSWTIQAPQTVGKYSEKFSLVLEGIKWFPIDFVVNVNVVPAVYKAQWVQQSPAPSLTPDSTASLWVEFKNTGNVTWKSDGGSPVRLGTARALDRVSQFYDPTWINQNRAAVMTPAVVEPGQIGRFEFKIKAPSSVGDYREYFRPVVETVTWLDDVGLYWDLKVEEELVIQDLIRVGLTSTTSPITVSGNSFSVRRAGDKSLIRKVNGSITVTPQGGVYVLSTGETVSGGVRFVPLNGTILRVDTAGIGAYDEFRGVIVVEKSALNNDWVVNHINVEDYMAGIAEVPEGWPAEAQKAQMVAARTYALKKRTESSSRDIFDVYDDTRHQVYFGYDYEKTRPNLKAAAVATAGMVIKYGNELASTYYFSDSGGYTEASYNVWGKGNPALSIPYLQAVPDPYAKNSPWSATLSQAYLKQRFDGDLHIAANGAESIQKIEVTERFISQRAKTVMFTLTSGRQVAVPFDRFDYLTNNQDVKSMIFDVRTLGPDSSPTDFVFDGRGWGHGVGLPQWSARNMADQGFTYNQILTYFFTGVNIVHT